MEREKFKKGIGDLKNIKLGENQRQVILSNLNEYISENPAVIKSPWFVTSQVFSMKHLSYAFILVLLVGVGGFGAVNTAKNSLPGDSLYSLKVDVIEPMQYTMAVGTVAKANIESQNLTERLIEAEVLASQGRLNDTSGQEIENRVKQHVDSFNSLVSGVNISAVNSVTVSDLKIDFEGAVNAHAKILEKITLNSNKKLENNKLSKIRDIVQAEAQKIDGKKFKRVDNVSMMAVSESIVVATSTDKEVFVARKKQIENIISNTKKNLEKNKKGKNDVNRQVLEESNKSLQDAEAALMRANQSENSGDRERAFSELDDSRRSAKEADTSLEASSHIRSDD